jgi:tellurite resistance protein
VIPVAINRSNGTGGFCGVGIGAPRWCCCSWCIRCGGGPASCSAFYQIYLGWMFMARRSCVGERFECVEATASVLAYTRVDRRESEKDKQIIQTTYMRAGFSAVEMREVDLTLEDCERAFRAAGSDTDRLFPLLRDACSNVARHSDHQIRSIFLGTALTIASSNGFVSSAEDKAIRAAALWLGLSTEDVNKAWTEARQRD